MKVLITGATGVLGRRLVQQLRDRGREPQGQAHKNSSSPFGGSGKQEFFP